MKHHSQLELGLITFSRQCILLQVMSPCKTEEQEALQPIRRRSICANGMLPCGDVESLVELCALQGSVRSCWGSANMFLSRFKVCQDILEEGAIREGFLEIIGKVCLQMSSAFSDAAWELTGQRLSWYKQKVSCAGRALITRIRYALPNWLCSGKFRIRSGSIQLQSPRWSWLPKSIITRFEGRLQPNLAAPHRLPGSPYLCICRRMKSRISMQG